MKLKNDFENKRLILNSVLIGCICITIFGLSIGYAALSSVVLTITGNASATQYAGMYISDVQYLEDTAADVASSKVVEYVGTMLHTDIFLSETDTSSSITYQVTIINNSDYAKTFTGVTYADGFYSNNDIVYELIGLKVGDHLLVGESQTFSIRFYYNNVSSITDNELDSYLNFNYDYDLEEEGDVDIYVDSTDPYEFPGVSPENPVSLANLSNVSFVVGNKTENVIDTINIQITYTTRTGSKQSGVVHLYNEAGELISSQTVVFLGKQTNTVKTLTFSGLNLTYGDKVKVEMDKSTITNGQVSVSSIVISVGF